MLRRNLLAVYSQGARFASTQAGPAGSGSGSNKFLLPGLVAAGAGIAYYAFNREPPTVVTSPKEPVFKGGDQGFVTLKVFKTENISPNTKRIVFDFDDAEAPSGIKYTSCLITRFKPDPEGKFVIRPYTPVNDEGNLGQLELVVKKYENGKMSKHIHDLVPGDTLDFKGPISKYPWAANKHDHIALLAGGTGITPMYQLIRGILNNPEDKTKITLVFGNISEEDILLHKELAHLETTHPRQFKAYYLLDKPSAEWQGGKGFITKDLLKTVLPEPKEADKIKIFVCGPPAMAKSISGVKPSPADQGELSGILKDLGYNKDQVYKF